jgi:hypothetical protein
MSETVVQSFPIYSTPKAFEWRDGQVRADVAIEWVPVARRTPDRVAKSKSLKALNAWFDANHASVMADAERACREATGRTSL